MTILNVDLVHMAFLQCCENEIIDEFPDYRKTNFGIHYMTDAARMLDSL